MNPSSPNKIRTRLAQAIAALFVVSVTILALSELVAKKPAESNKSIKKQATEKANPKTTSKATLAGTPTPTPTPTLTPAPLCDWPPKKEEDQCTVMKAFVEALKRSTQPNNTIREKLLSCTDANNCSSARDAVQGILTEFQSDIPIPKNHLVICYFDPNVPGGGALTQIRQSVAQNSCYTILSLPSEINPPPLTYWNKPPAVIFDNHVRCCYQPWTPAGCK